MSKAKGRTAAAEEAPRGREDRERTFVAPADVVSQAGQVPGGTPAGARESSAIRQFELVERVKSYDTATDEDALNRAYVFAMKAHGAQVRESGAPYFTHPLEVAAILTRYKLDSATIITALLHDTIEDTAATLDDITRLFGAEIARLVDGVTKLTRIDLQSDHTKQAENFRKLLLAMSEDLRVLLVKLADRLHNMRTLFHVKLPERRLRVAHETMEIYAPLADRIGMHDLKDELEDLAFTEINGEARESIIRRLAYLREEGHGLVPRIIDALGHTLGEGGVEAKVIGREKTPYSVWRKMQRKNVGFEQLSDIMAFRVAVGTMAECYQALGLIHCAYSVVPGQFKDYISTPKPNAYRSLHTIVIGPERQRIEVQIRTEKMDEVAENGVAAHWNYKGDEPKTDTRDYRWLRHLLDILDHAAGPDDFLEHTKLEMFRDQVFCFSPRGDLISLPQGATPVDFAYAIHSEVGDTCVGAKVNGRLAPLKIQLQNGDQVEIVGSTGHSPSPTWESFVVTGKARACIRRYVRTQQRAQHIDLGRSILTKQIRQEGYEIPEEGLAVALERFECVDNDDLHAMLGEGRLTGREVAEVLFAATRSESRWANIVPIRWAKKQLEKDEPIPIRGLIPGMAVHYAGCCTPLRGDRIVGIVTTGKGITIHTIDCESLESFSATPERWVDVTWDDQASEADSHLGRLNVLVENKPGSLGAVSTVIGGNGGNITNLRFTNRAADFFEMNIDIEVKDVRHLTDIIAALRATREVSTVARARG
jgi:guanosine-3',5'-bis(diphosphate) 3'-pyrophosphohydrolase